MTKHLLLSGALLCALMAQAETKFYTSEELGVVAGISDNGRYAAVFDDENSLGYLWDAENPEVFTPVTGFQSSKVELYDVADDGTAVGCYYLGGRYYPCIFKDGEIKALELSQYALNTNTARCISADGKYIGGYQHYYDPTIPINGRYRPCVWTRNDEGEYDLFIYADLEMPDHQGFILNAMNEDATILAGRLYCGFGSEIPAIVKDGELVIWNNLEVRTEPFYYKGQILSYDDFVYIDGYRDGWMDGNTTNTLTGEFSSIDAWGNIYGCRSKVEDLAEDGLSCTIRNYACMYNPATDEWFEVPASGGIRAFTTGLKGQYFFCNGNNVLISIEEDTAQRKESLTNEFGFTPNNSIAGVFRTSADGKVFGGATQMIHPATGEPQFFPFIVVLDEPLVEGPHDGVEILPVAKNLAVVLSAGRIDIAGAEGTVYDLDGRMIGTGTTFNVTPGTYVVKSGETSCKVLVK